MQKKNVICVKTFFKFQKIFFYNNTPIKDQNRQKKKFGNMFAVNICFFFLQFLVFFGFKNVVTENF